MNRRLRQAGRAADATVKALVIAWLFCGVVLTLAGLVLVLAGDADTLDVIILCTGVLLLALLASQV